MSKWPMAVSSGGWETTSRKNNLKSVSLMPKHSTYNPCQEAVNYRLDPLSLTLSVCVRLCARSNKKVRNWKLMTINRARFYGLSLPLLSLPIKWREQKLDAEQLKIDSKTWQSHLHILAFSQQIKECKKTLNLPVLIFQRSHMKRWNPWSQLRILCKRTFSSTIAEQRR